MLIIVIFGFIMFLYNFLPHILNAQNYNDRKKLNWRKLEIERLRALAAFLKEAGPIRRKRMAELSDSSPPPPAPQPIQSV